MLADAENALIALVKGAPLGRALATVASLPDLEGDSLVKRFGAEAPAVYVSVASFPVADGAAVLKLGLAGVARNSRGAEAARQGDGKSIGLYQILEGVAALTDGAVIGGATWRVIGVDFMADGTLYANGLHAGVVRIESAGAVTLPPALDEAALDEFLAVRADYDIAPPVAPAEHDKWLGDPPDHGSAAPDFTDPQSVRP